MPAAFPRVSSASLSEQGYVRPENEDRIYCDDAHGIYVVVDGMGGHAAGEQAATLAMERLCARLERATDSPEQRLREAIALANNAVYEEAQARPEWRGMACVLTAAIVTESQVTVGHVGDSRLYKIRRGVIQKITRDHSPIGEREDAGEISERDAMNHPRRNEVYRDVGSQEHAPDDPDFIDVVAFPFEPDSAILLCTDGLSDVISSEQILRTAQEDAADPSMVVRSLVTAATRVGQDNVSVIFVAGDAFAKTRAGSRTTHAIGEQPNEADRTDRLTAFPARGKRNRWFANSSAYFAYGMATGALLLFASLQVMPRQSEPPQARTIRVTAPATIAQALASARAGDTVVLNPGTYTEVVHLKDRVDLRSSRPQEAVIEGALIAEKGVVASVQGVRVLASDLGIIIRDSKVSISDTDVSGAGEAGIEILGTSQGTVTGCRIHDNAGAGLVVLDTAESIIRNNVISANGTVAGRLRPGLLLRSTSRSTINGNIIAGNGSDGVWLQQDDPDLLRHNAFSWGGDEEKRRLLHIVSGEAKPQ